MQEFSRIQNLHISQTLVKMMKSSFVFSRIQNLHISQTKKNATESLDGLVEFKIYISLKQ